MKKFDLHLSKYGVSLGVKDGQFRISHPEHKQSIPANKISNIVLHKSCKITGAAIKLALNHHIDISFVERDGFPFARIWDSKFGSIATVRRNQLSFSNSKEALVWIKKIVELKLQRHMGLIAELTKENKENSREIEAYKIKSARYLASLLEFKTDDVNILREKLLGWEAAAAKLHYKALNTFLPPAFQFHKRSKFPAEDPFNAVLNYCNGILYNKIEGFMIRSGIDPQIGIFHRDQYKKPVLTYDFIECFRHWSEYVAVKCFSLKLLDARYFDDSGKGVRIIHKGKGIIIEVFFQYMNEKVVMKSNRKKRMDHIKSEIEEFASSMKNYKLKR